MPFKRTPRNGGFQVLKAEPPKLGDACPQCAGELVRTTARHGRVFFEMRAWLVCEAWPECDFAVCSAWQNVAPARKADRE